MEKIKLEQEEKEAEEEAIEEEEIDLVAAEYEDIEGLIRNPRTQQDYEHNAYLRLLREYNNFLKKRDRCRKVGLLVIVLVAVLFLVLMFSLESKIVFLTLWIISIFASVFTIVHIDYRCYKYAIILGIHDNGNE